MVSDREQLFDCVNDQHLDSCKVKATVNRIPTSLSLGEQPSLMIFL